MEKTKALGKVENTPQVSSTSRTPHPSMLPSSFGIGVVQSAVGNMAMQGASPNALRQLLQAGQLQAKLIVGATDDPAEREADRMAEAAMHGGSACSCSPGAPPCSNCHGAQNVVRRKPRSTSIHLSTDNLSLGAGRPLTIGERSFFEPRYDLDLSEVRVHDNEQAASSALQINARAFTVGSDIAFGHNEYNSDNSAGKLLLAHELAHVVQQDRSTSPAIIRRVGLEDPPFGYFPAERRVLEAEARERREREQRHQAWDRGVHQQFRRDLSNQSSTVGEERERLELALTSQRAAAIDAVAGGQGWLNQALRTQNYAGPELTQIKQLWADAFLAAELVKAAASSGTITPDVRLTGLESIPAFYNALDTFARAAEQAHRTHVQTENDRLSAQYRAAMAQYERGREIDEETIRGFGGEPGARAAAAGMRMGRELRRPDEPNYLRAPPSISHLIADANTRVYAAEGDADWTAVARDVNRLGNGFATLVVASLPVQSDLRVGIQHLEQLDIRLAGLERTNPLAVRIPAVFYPKDRTLQQRNERGEMLIAPESIPWQFYLINTGVTSRDEPARAGEWVLIDLTSTRRFENKAPASMDDSIRLRRGEDVDPPIGLFSELNSRIRFPEGHLFFTLPSRTSYWLETTEPWSLSDWLSAIATALAAIALVAAVVATGGAAAPAAVALYAGLGAAAVGIGSTLASLHEKSQHGILTDADVDEAMISIGIDVVSALSMGLGRLVAAPRALARLGLTGERFITLQRVTQVARAGAIAGDVYQAWSLTSGLVSSLNAIENQPGLTDEERKRMRGQLVRRALLTGALLGVAIRGDIGDYRAGRTLRVSHMDPDGALVPMHADTDTPRSHADVPGATTAAHAAPHADVTGPVHADSARMGGDLMIGRQSHSLAVGGSGPTRDFYFCSDRCGPIINQLEAIVDVLPRAHPERRIFQDLLSRARGARRRLRRGQLSEDQANAIAGQISEDLARHSRASELFAALMNTDTAMLAMHRGAIRARLAQSLRLQTLHAASQSERQAANQGVNRGREPLEEPDAHSPIETDLLGGLGMREAQRPGGRLQPLRFDVGNFSHTHAEALVPGLPRGCNREVRVTLSDGEVGRADRVFFIHDADGDRIGAHVFEVKPDTPDQIERGRRRAQEYLDGIAEEIETNLREKGKAVPTVDHNGAPLYSSQVLTYNREQMRSVLRALRGGRVDPLRMAEYEAVVRQVFDAVE